MKAAPHRIADGDFAEVAERLRDRLARLVGAPTDEIVLGNSTSYGLHLIANGLNWQNGDEILVVEGDYPATVLPWHRVAREGAATVRTVPAGVAPADALGPRTRLLAVTWVDSFTGRTLDVDALGAACRRAGVLLVVNASQALGARAIDVTRTPVDAVVACGYKWLCGPYGTGFAWIGPDLLRQLRPQQAYWLAMQAGRGLDRMRETAIRDDLGVRAFDVFCPANFATALPWIASLDLLLEAGIDRIDEWNQRLVQRLIDGLDGSRLALVSPPDGPARSSIVVLSGGDSAHLAAEGIDTAFREGNLRVSLHLFNTAEQVDRLLEALHRQH
jgi:selenocysteine lyase/cysteine desulfurase